MLTLFCFLLALPILACASQPEVLLVQGPVRGVYENTLKGRQIASFWGIPYAKPPAGKHRFKESVPLISWPGTYNATRRPPACLQYSHFTYKTKFPVYGSEDCLYVNVFSPKLPAATGAQDKLLDVVVNIHGGAFMFLQGDVYNPTVLLDHDVVLVTLNYRLGSLGFLGTEDAAIPGNNGLKDQVLALKWVQENIASFGGNPLSVTIAGLSAGGASVHYHVLSPLSKGLFHRAISMSGVSFNPWALQEKPRQKADYIAAQLGCPTHDSHLMVRCLRTRPAEHIVQLTSDFQEYLYNPFSPFAPVVEPASVNAFLPDTPINIVAEGLAHDVPLLLSFTSEEGLYPGAELVGDEEHISYLKDHLDQLLPHILDYNFTAPAELHPSIAAKIKEHYKIDLEKPEGITNFIKMLGDRLFVDGIVHTVKLHALHSISPIYLYHFRYRGKFSCSSLFTDKDLGVSHADDLFYVLPSHLSHSQETPDDLAMTDFLSNVWASFAVNGTITDWRPIKDTSSGLDIVNILGPGEIEQTIDSCLGESDFWDSLQLQENLLEQQQLPHEEL